MNKLSHELIPENIEGKQNDLEQKISFNTDDEAREKFKKCVQKLFDVNHWKTVSDDKGTEFFVTDKNGNICQRPVEEGDCLKIDIPGPGNTSGDGFDWVRVVKVVREFKEEDEYEGAGFTVRATGNPENNDRETAHFFSKSATSTFMIERKGKEIISSYHGRNENVNKEGNILDKVRNAVVGAGALAGLSEVKWKDLIESFLKN